MDSLPNECLLQIIGNLGFNDLLTCQQVSRRLRAVSIRALSSVNLLNLDVIGVGFIEPRKKKREFRPLVTREVVVNMGKKIGYRKTVNGVSVSYNVHYLLASNFKRSELEKELQQMWEAVFLLLRHCDTTYTYLDLRGFDIHGVAARQLQMDAATYSSLIFVDRLHLSTDMALFVNNVRGSSNNRLDQYPSQSWREDFLSPHHKLSTWPAWNVFHQGQLSRCFLVSTGIDSEPKWSVNKLVNLIQKWQNGAGFRMLFFEGFAYERGENETNDNSFYTETLKILENMSDDRFQYSTDVFQHPDQLQLRYRTLGKTCTIKIVNVMGGTELNVSIAYLYKKLPCMATRSGVRRQIIDRSSAELYTVKLEQSSSAG